MKTDHMATSETGGGGVDPFSLCPDAQDVDEILRYVHPADLVTTVSQGCGTAYWDEAMIHWARARARGPDKERLDTLPRGIHPDHPLFTIREAMLALVEKDPTAATPGVRLLLWGASVHSGKNLFREAAALVRCKEIREELEQNPSAHSHLEIQALVVEWARASGVTNRKTRDSLPGLCRDVLLHERPDHLYVPLDSSVLVFVTSLARDRKVAYLLFRCIQRAVAFARNGEVRWRSSWLHGEGANADAIPGASGPAMRRELNRLLHGRVLERTENWSAGKKAATYRFRVQIGRGTMDARDAAACLGIKLDARLAPSATGRTRRR